MCEIKKNLQVTMTANELVECIDEMHDAMTPAERMAALESLVPTKTEIIELLRLNKETSERANKTGACPAFWCDDDLYKMIKIMFDPRSVMMNSQLAACVNEVIFKH